MSHFIEPGDFRVNETPGKEVSAGTENSAFLGLRPA